MTNPPVIQLSLATALPAYRPGETVTALLHATTSLPEDIELKELEIVFAGIERVDTSWVAPSYRRNTAAINSDRRRVQRNVVMANLQAATQGNFSDGNLRRFLIRFKLPLWLPPTFKGTAVRYSYYLDAHLNYFQYDTGVVAAAAATGADPPKQGQPGSTSTRLALHIWPDQESTASASSNDNLNTSINLASRNATTIANSDVFPLVLGEDGSIKCWEVGPGTAVEDAISHISKLVTAGSGIPLSPFSPGRMKTSLSRQASSGPLLAAAMGGSSGGLGGRGGANDSASEISHDEGPGSALLGAVAESLRNESAGGGTAAALQPPSLSRLSIASDATDRSNTTTTTTTTPGAQQSSGVVQSAEAGGSGGLRTFALRIGNTPLVKVSIHPPLMGPLQPGATVAGTLEFPTTTSAPLTGDSAGASTTAALSNSGLRCMQVSIMLETEESVDSIWRPVGKGSSSASGMSTTGGGGSASSLRKLLEEQIEVTADTACTNFIFSIPPDATPTFQTPLVGLRWVLRFHFMAMRQEKGAKIEQLSWTLPLVVLPPPKAA